MKYTPLLLLYICLMLLTGCGCFRPSPIDGLTRVEYRDSLIYIRGATLRDTITTETVRYDTLNKLLTIKVRDTFRIREQHGIRLTTRIGRAGVVTHVERLDTTVLVRNVTEYRDKLIYVEAPAAESRWWKWLGIGLGIGLVLGLLLALLLARR